MLFRCAAAKSKGQPAVRVRELTVTLDLCTGIPRSGLREYGRRSLIGLAQMDVFGSVGRRFSDQLVAFSRGKGSSN